MFNNFALVCFGALLSALGFVLKRSLTGEKSKERAERLAVLAELQVKLHSGDITIGELENLEEWLIKPANRKADMTLEEARKSGQIDGLTQVEMNLRAGIDLKKAQLELQHTLGLVKIDLEPTELRLLDEAQELWSAFSVKQADFEAEMYDGGSIQPLIWATAVEDATRQRTKELNLLYEGRQNL
tara:strand:+ start:2383 stop:2937 length:555 start_codon:yes stop_codon:yes gene_type:complete